MAPPLVTVITPVRDAREYLDAWFASLREQTLAPGERSDLVNLFGPAFLLLDAEERARPVAAAGELARAHLTDAIRARCTESQRLRLHCLQHGFTDELTALVRHECEHGALPEPVTATASWAPDGLRVHTSLPPAPRAVARAGRLALPHPRPPQRPRGRGRRGRHPAAGAAAASTRSALRVEATYAGSAVEGAIALDPALRQRRVWHSGRFYRVTPSPAPDGTLLVQAAPIRIRRVVRLRLRRMAGRDGA